MKKDEMERKINYFFIDESGDATFYANRGKLLVGTEGFQPLLTLGMIAITNKAAFRKSIVDFQEQIKSDPLYNSLPCINNPKGWYLHARGDSIEIRAKFVEFLRKLEGFKTYVVIGRKRLKTFQRKHNNNPSEFYFDLVYHLIKDRLNKENEFYRIFLSAREKSTQQYLGEAISKAVERDDKFRKTKMKIEYSFDIVRSCDTPELSVIDYMLWALQRYILRGEGRYYNALKDKYNLIIDVYDIDKYKIGNYYNRKNPFSIEKASPFKNDGY